MFGLSTTKNALKFMALAVILIGVAACARHEAVYTVENHPIPAIAQKLALPEIEKAIMLAGTQRNWRFEQVKPGLLKGRFFDGKHEALIDVTYSQTAYSIGLNSTMGLKQTDSTIHGSYNRWIRFLERDIEERLYKAGLEKT